VHFVVVRLEGFGGGERFPASRTGAEEDSNLLAEGVVYQMEGVWVAFSFQVRLDGGSSGEAREMAANGVIASPDWTGLRPNVRREQTEQTELPALQ